MKQFVTNSGERKTSEIMGRGASWSATFAFSLCMFTLKLSKPLLQPKGSHSLWLAIGGLFSFLLLASSASVMNVVGARFTRMQIIVMLVAFFTLLLA